MTLRAKLMLQVGVALLLALGVEIGTVILLQRRTFGTILSELGLDVPWVFHALDRLELAELLYAGLNAVLIFGFWIWLLERSLVRPIERLESALDPAAAGLAALTDRARQQKETVREQRAQLEVAEAQLTRAEQLALMGRLGAGLAHEIGNPLGAVTGYLSLVRDEPSAEVRSELLARSETELQRISGLIRELLDYARPSALKREPVDLRMLIENARGLLTHQPRGREVTLDNRVPSDVLVMGDAQRVVQVLLNVFLNSADAMQGAGTIEVRSERRGQEVELTISDSGPGFSPEALAHAGEPFFTTKSPGHGTGLGLAVSLTLVRELGGTLRFGNAQNGGALIALSLRAV